MNTIRDKAPQARRMADELEALLPSAVPEPQKPIGPSEKERQLGKDLAVLADRNRALMAELKELRGVTAQQHDGSIATIVELESQINALNAELKGIKKQGSASEKDRHDALAARIAELEEDKHELEIETASLRKEALDHANNQPDAAPDQRTVMTLQKENIGLKEGNQKLLARLNKAQAENDQLKTATSGATAHPPVEELAQLRTQQEAQAAKIRELNRLIEERDTQLENALTPEALEEVKRTFADAIYNTFKEVDNKNPGFLSNVLTNPKISPERKEWIIEAFRANGEEIILDL